MQRGDVYRSEILLPDRKTGQGLIAKPKYVVVLNPYNHSDISVVICDTDKAPGRQYRAFEVALGTSHGFQHPQKSIAAGSTPSRKLALTHPNINSPSTRPSCRRYPTPSTSDSNSIDLYSRGIVADRARPGRDTGPDATGIPSSTT